MFFYFNYLFAKKDSERSFIYDLQNFANLERKHYFDLEKIEKDIIANKLNGINSKIYFILQLGYFKLSHRFFKFIFNEVVGDVAYILEKYFPEQSLKNIKQNCDRKTIFNHQSIILKLFSKRFPMISKITTPMSFAKMNELVKYDILIDESEDKEDREKVGLLN